MLVVFDCFQILFSTATDRILTHGRQDSAMVAKLSLAPQMKGRSQQIATQHQEILWVWGMLLMVYNVLMFAGTYAICWAKSVLFLHPFLDDLALNDSNGQPPRHRAVSSTDGLTTVTAMKNNETWFEQRGMEKHATLTLNNLNIDIQETPKLSGSFPDCRAWVGYTTISSWRIHDFGNFGGVGQFLGQVKSTCQFANSQNVSYPEAGIISDACLWKYRMSRWDRTWRYQYVRSHSGENKHEHGFGRE